MSESSTHRRGFTLVEIMIVVVIIGLINAIALPAMADIRQRTLATRMANDFRLIKDGIEFGLTELGYAPRDGYPNRHPSDLQPYLPSDAMERSFINATWDWENWTGRRRQFDLGLTLRWRGNTGHSAQYRDELMTQVDAILDDGDLSSGVFQKETRFGGYAIIFD